MKKSKIMYLMSAALLLAGCAADEQQVPVSQRVPITLNTLMVEGSLTRADNVNIQSTQFDKNQTFYAYFPENVTVGEVTSASHAVYTTDGVGNTTTAPQPYFNAEITSATVHAYYPYFSGDGGKQVTNATESFSVEKNQHQVSGYNESDLMYATTTVEKTSPTGTLLFTHKMAKIIVNASAADNLTITDVRIVGGYRTINIPEAGRVSCTLGTSLSDANSTDNYITMFTGGNNATAVCAALLPPQELSSSNALIEIVTIDGNNEVASAKYSIAKTIESANSYTLNLTVTQASLNNTTAISNWSNNSGSTDSGELVIADISDCPRTGYYVKPEPIVRSNGVILSKGIDYELSYNNNYQTGVAVVFAIGKGVYEGKIAAKNFNIITDIKMNPLWYMAECNVSNADGTEMDIIDNDRPYNERFYFNGRIALKYFTTSDNYDSNSPSAINSYTTGSGSKISGYHLPIMDEWRSIMPFGSGQGNFFAYATSSEPISYKRDYNPSVFGYNEETKAGIKESSFWRYVSSDEVHAIRFLGTAYCSAWKYVFDKTGTKLFKIYATLIDIVDDNESAAYLWYKNNWANTPFENDESVYAIYRSLYAGGIKTSNSWSDVSRCNYWSSSGYYSSYLYLNYIECDFQYSNASTYGMNATDYGMLVRLFRDN